MEKFAPEAIVLDDALQFWQLHRDLDIVLLDARHPFDNGYVLPRGLLREPPSHLRRAGIVVLTRSDRVPEYILAKNLDRVQKLAPEAEVFTAVHAPVCWVDIQDNTFPLESLQGQTTLAFSGIADGDAFLETVKNLGITVGESRSFGDHHTYTGEDIAALVRPGLPCVTTEKDLVKVGALWPKDAPPLYALRIGMAVNDEPRFFDRIRKVLR